MRRRGEAAAPETNRHAEPHILRRLGDALPRATHQIALLQCLEAEVVQCKVPGGIHHGIEGVGIVTNKRENVGGQRRSRFTAGIPNRGQELHGVAEGFGGRPLTVAEDDLGGQSAPVGMDREIGDRHAGGQLI